MKTSPAPFRALIAFAVIAVSAVMFAVSASAASQLSAKQVENFIGSLGPVNAMSEQMRAEGKQDALTADMEQMQAEGFKPYTSGIKALKEKFGDDYKKLGGIVKKHGFSSQEQWANIGDAVMLSYIALKAEQQNPDFANMEPQISPEMLAQMPPEARTQIERSMHMMKAVKSVPAADKEVVKPFVAQIDSVVEKNRSSNAGTD